MSTPAEPRAAAGRPGQGVIHDLGYRHYDGVRLGRAAITRALFVESAKGAYGLGRSTRSKVMPLLLLAAISLPALIIAVVAAVTAAITAMISAGKQMAASSSSGITFERVDRPSP